MNDDADFDTWLAHQLHEAPLADAGFCAAIEQRMAARRSRRRAWRVIATLCAIASAASALWLHPVLPSAAAMASPATVAAALILTTLCGMVWIATETPSPRGTNAAG